MAGFKTHLKVALGVSGVLSIISLGTGIANPTQISLFFMLGAIGGILPDIDSDSSIPLKFLSFTVGLLLAFLVILAKVESYSIIELIISWVILYSIFHYSLLYGFRKFTNHRGMIHSIPAGLIFMLITVLILHNLFGFSEFKSWLGGTFIFFGFLSHLILDEIYSVDIKGKKLKKSFGTALKLYQPKDARSTLIIYSLVGVLIYNSPSIKTFQYIFTSDKFYMRITNNLLPNGLWFGDIQESVKSSFNKINGVK